MSGGQTRLRGQWSLLISLDSVRSPMDPADPLVRYRLEFSVGGSPWAQTHWATPTRKRSHRRCPLHTDRRSVPSTVRHRGPGCSVIGRVDVKRCADGPLDMALNGRLGRSAALLAQHDGHFGAIDGVLLVD